MTAECRPLFLLPPIPPSIGIFSSESTFRMTCLRKGTPLASRVAQGVSGPSSSVCGTHGSLRTMHGGGSAPSCCAFTNRVAFEEGSGSSHGRGLGPRDALKKDSRGLSRGTVGNPRVPGLLPGTLGNFPGPTRLLCPWDFPGKSTGVSALASFLAKKSQG